MKQGEEAYPAQPPWPLLLYEGIYIYNLHLCSLFLYHNQAVAYFTTCVVLKLACQKTPAKKRVAWENVSPP